MRRNSPTILFSAVGLFAVSIVMGLAVTAPADEPEAGIKVPVIAGPYTTVYRPAGDRFPGPSTDELTAGQFYDDWVPNDHAIVKGPDGCWHAIGITHPLTSTDRIHEGEFQSFHAVAPAGPLSGVLRDGAWKDRPKILPPSERPGEILANHAPFIIRQGGRFRMIYGPSPLRWASSSDLTRWTPRGAIAGERSGGRDPNLFQWQGTWHLVYCVDDRVEVRTSSDLTDWSEPRAIVTMPKNIAPESPSLIRYNETFYLFVCGWNGIWDRKTVQGAYQHTTYVYQSDDPIDFGARVAVTSLQAHAPEIFADEEGDWFISSVEWPQRGVSIAPLQWSVVRRSAALPKEMHPTAEITDPQDARANVQPKWSELYQSQIIEFEVDGAPAFVVKPRKERSDGKRPWVWYAPSLREDDGKWVLPAARHAQVVSTLLDHGFCFCGVHVGESYGSPAGRDVFTKFHERVVRQFGLSDKACLFPVSRGGLMHYNWAAEHPERVACIGAIYPVCDVTDRPGLAKASQAYGITVTELEEGLSKHNPIERLAPLASRRIPILHLHGDSDTVVPLERHSAEVARRYEKLGGECELIVVPGKGHELAAEIWKNARLTKFFLKHAR